MPPEPKVLVIGTTPDYIDWIADACPGQALFITDPSVRTAANRVATTGYDEILCNLADYGQVLRRLKTYLDVHELFAQGVACFDCESMELAAVIARMYGRPFPSLEAIHTCRSKRQTRLVWHTAGVPCPVATPVFCEDDVLQAWETIKKPVVLKPDSGSGSELVFKCRSRAECRKAYHKIRMGLDQRAASRIYCDTSSAGKTTPITIEEFVGGVEYSCDFILDNHQAAILRLCRKTLSAHGPFGTTRAYTLINALPAPIDMDAFEQMLIKSAEALGLSRAICMLDMIVQDGQPVFLEMAPRPGGDCIPFLLKTCRGLDILKLAVDFARAAPNMDLPETVSTKTPPADIPFTGVRLHATREGVLKKIDTRRLANDPRVHDIFISRPAGHLVRMPPEDYDSWLLGHVIMTPRPDVDIDAQAYEIAEKIELEYDRLEIQQPRRQSKRRYAPAFSEGRHAHPAGQHPASAGGVLLQPGG